MIGRMDKNNNNNKNTLNEKVDLDVLNMMAKDRIKQGFTSDLSVFERVARKVASKIAYGAKSDPVLAEALQTRQVPNSIHRSVQVGNYAVFSIPNANGKNRYDVADQNSGNKLVGDLYMVETANAIVKLMNKGHSFYSPEIKNLLEFESTYKKHYADAVSLSRKIKNNPMKDAIMETRFTEAKQQAQAVKENLSRFVQKL